MVCTLESCEELSVTVTIARVEWTYHLLCYHHDSLDGELSVAVIEEVLQAGAEKVNDEDVVETLLAKVVHIGDSSCSIF
jgi:hypothetical protein